MKLDLVLGASGSGKTAEILRRVKLLLANRKNLTERIEEKIIVLVPDQYTVSTERFYLEKIGEEAMPFIKILSMKRLASFIFTEFGIGKKRLYQRRRSKCPDDEGYPQCQRSFCVLSV